MTNFHDTKDTGPFLYLDKLFCQFFNARIASLKKWRCLQWFFQDDVACRSSTFFKQNKWNFYSLRETCSQPTVSHFTLNKSVCVHINCSFLFARRSMIGFVKAMHSNLQIHCLSYYFMVEGKNEFDWFDSLWIFLP